MKAQNYLLGMIFLIRNYHYNLKKYAICLIQIPVYDIYVLLLVDGLYVPVICVFYFRYPCIVDDSTLAVLADWLARLKPQQGL